MEQEPTVEGSRMRGGAISSTLAPGLRSAIVTANTTRSSPRRSRRHERPRKVEAEGTRSQRSAPGSQGRPRPPWEPPGRR